MSPETNMLWFLGIFSGSLLNGIAVITITGFLWKAFHAHDLRHKAHEEEHEDGKAHAHAMEEAIKAMQSEIEDLKDR